MQGACHHYLLWVVGAAIAHRLCKAGNSMYSQLEDELHFGFRRTGALVIGFDEADEKSIKALYDNGINAGCEDLQILHGDELRELEPHLNPKACVALYAKSVGVASPYELTIALVENAIANGLVLELENEVLSIEKQEDCFTVHTDKKNIQCRYLINATGINSDTVAAMLYKPDFKIHPRKGQYILFGKDQSHLVKRVIFQTPTKYGKGILVTTTYHGNFMIGPDAEDIGTRDDTSTSLDSLTEIVVKARESIPDFNIARAITTFSGMRPISDRGDFIIEESPVKGFINVAGIDSPGLTSAPAIAVMVLELLQKSDLKLIENPLAITQRNPIFHHKDKDFQGKVDHTDPALNIICRCEGVTEAEILDALSRGIPINDTDAIKRRTRAGMGPCQGNFCSPRVKALISKATGLPVDTISNRTESSKPNKADIKLIRKL